MSLRACVVTLAFAAVAAHGAEPEPGLVGKAELGYLATSGNSDTSSLNAKLAMSFEAVDWRHSLNAAAVQSEDSGITTAERYQFGVKSDYKINEHDYLFVTVNWEQDEFAGFSQRTSEAVGYGRRLISSPAHHLDLELGVGLRQTDLVLGPSVDETILRAAGKYKWTISESSTFDQSLIVEKGDETTYTESVSALGVRINGALSLKVSYTIKNNSKVPVGLENTDTYTAIGIEYSF
jgi:putative salt-induced outer membrane protein